MDNGTRIHEDVEVFLRAARAKDTLKCAQLLKEKPTLINSVEAGGFSALHFAAFNGDLDMICMLLEFKPDLELKNYDNNTPLIMAAKGHQNAAIKLLVEAGADVNLRTPTGGTAAHFAASMGYVDTVRCLVELGADVMHDNCQTGTLLHWAAHSGNIDCIGEMIYGLKVPIDVKDAHGGTALFTALFMKKVEAVEFLLEHGADAQVTIEEDQSTPLHIAVEHANTECVKLLLAFGANPQAANKSGETPVALAEKAKNDSALKELLKPMLGAERRKEEAARFKAQGNKVFEAGENVKAAKFYTLAIHMDNNNAVFFSNRAAAYFNQRYYNGAYWDSLRCISLSADWPKGYFRKAATELAMKKFDEALQTCEQGLRLDSKNKDLLTTKEEARRQRNK
ncbi:putative ankyrin repeat family protein [Trypanosoma rangeli]|uniref:Putative ankyrin repeat family protein n=1 Tax=Trypanosoma rangeli TaxID=5698 RepID=A0A3R7N419_TRYRA|nr:putative ankyrin repeat family protein [Trypanosoma rangeli]RNF12476.1 putative ankyrin repeat family protein [Trypanosoma rangeli]|eukprot:RNF12476.1 putative ankyrin repeat family protein [Trypanosoma rangeli]